MAGIQISNLLSNSAFDWKSVVDQLIAADSAPITALQKEQTTNTRKITALDGLKTALIDLQDSLQSIRSSDLFSARTVSTDTANTTWKSSSAKGAPVGTYTFAVSQLATKAQISGVADIGSGLNATNDVSGLTLANLNTATAVTAGTFTVNGAQVTIDTTDSLQGVFDKISTATGGDVTGSYDSTTDRITLTGASGSVVLGAANDTSNFLRVMKLTNNGTGTVTSSAKLGTVKQAATLDSAGLKTALSSSTGSFTINGVSISYDATADTLGTLLSRINQSGAGVTASYDSVNDRVLLVNNSTGDIGLGLSDTTGNMLAALGLTSAAGGTFTRGLNAEFTVNGGPTLTSMSNTLDDSVHGITGLNVTVNTATTQTLQVESDTNTMSAAIQDFIDKFNAVQTNIETNTKITITGGTVTTSILSDNREVQDWASKLQNMAFSSVTGVTGSIQRLNNLGIDFNSTTGQLTVKDTGKLASALSEKPDDVQSFFLTANTGFVGQMYGYLTSLISADGTQQSNLTKANSDLDTQIATLQSRLDKEREQLTNAFIAMQDAQSKANSQQTYLTNTFFKNNSSS
jgi:flagellar hook-associated protein 2